MQSGSTANPWARKLPNPRQMVYRICARLGNGSRDHSEIVAFLRSLDGQDIARAQQRILTNKVSAFQFRKGECEDSKLPLIKEEK